VRPATLRREHSRLEDKSAAILLVCSQAYILRVETNVLRAKAVVEEEENRFQRAVPLPMPNDIEILANSLGRAEDLVTDQLGDDQCGGFECVEGVLRGHDILDVASGCNRLEGWMKAMKEMERYKHLDSEGCLEVELDRWIDAERHICVKKTNHISVDENSTTIMSNRGRKD
jgi:hypothetical protein